MKYCKVDFDRDYSRKNNCEIKGNIKLDVTDNNEAEKIVKNYFKQFWNTSFREPSGDIKHPFLVPGADYNDLWDWDSYFMACSASDEGLEYVKGSICNLIEHHAPDGRPVKRICPDGTCDFLSHPYPLAAQFTYIAAKRMNDFSWVEQYWDDLVLMNEWYEKNCMKNGYFVWLHLFGNGLDNNPAVYGRADMTSAGIDLAVWHYREYNAMKKLSGILNKGQEEKYAQKAENLKRLIIDKYFDERDESFYNIDCATDYSRITLQGVEWVTHLKFRSWATLFPLWGKAASDEQAEKMMKLIMNKDEFLADCGIRSHSRNDMVYNNVPMGNPSNWQGPVWGLSTFLTAYGMAKYGYKKEALDVAYRLIRTFASDINQNGCVHEYYHGDTSQPVIRPYFLSWNMLAVKVIDDINNGTDCTTLDILD